MESNFIYKLYSDPHLARLSQELQRYEKTECDIKTLSHLDLETIRDLFAKGYRLASPKTFEFGGWISVKDALPKIGQRVLVVCTNSQNVMQAHVSIATLTTVRKGQGVWSGRRLVTDWMPLPEIKLSMIGEWKEKQMSYEYDQYLRDHRNYVASGFYWLRDNLPDILRTENPIDLERQICNDHDWSKDAIAEYDAYDAYFYGKNKSYEVVQNFNRAWLHHIHRNPHHWQYWVLINDDPGEGEVILDMDYGYIIELICDWWSFSWKKGNLYEIFSWYDDHKAYIKLSPKTRKTVEDILDRIREKLDELEFKEEK